MATFAATANDDAVLDDLGYQNSPTTDGLGECGSGPPTDSGQGWQFTGAGALDGATINSAYMTIVKSTTEWVTVDHFWSAVDQDNTAVFSSGSPPGSRAIVSTEVSESLNINHVDTNSYDYPNSGANQTSLGAAIQEVTDRASYGTRFAVVNNSAQGAAGGGFARENVHYLASSGNEPAITIDYTPAATGGAMLVNGGKLVNGGILSGRLVR